MLKMTKIKKIFSFVSISLLSTTCLVIPCFATSCSTCSYPPASFDDEHIQYIYNRSFSLLTEYTSTIDSKRYFAWGTTWILSKVNDENLVGDYWYYMATNYHVISTTMTKLSTNASFYLSDYYQGEYSAQDNHYRAKVDEIELVKEYFTYDSNSRDNSIDFVVLKANLQPVIDKFGEGSAIKTKIDNLNKYNEEQKCINHFKKTLSDDDKTIEDCFCAGFPAVTSEFKRNTKFCYERIPQVNIDRNASHNCVDGSEEAKIIGQLSDQSWNYYAPFVDDSAFSLTGGASGSMLIDKDFNVLGIYWGGIEQNRPFHQKEFQPRFSIFSSDQKDFLLEL